MLGHASASAKADKEMTPATPVDTCARHPHHSLIFGSLPLSDHWKKLYFEVKHGSWLSLASER